MQLMAGVGCRSAERAACRKLLRICRALDDSPEQLVPLLGLSALHHGRRVDAKSQQLNHVRPFVQEALWKAMGGFSAFSQPGVRSSCAVSAAREHFRRSVAIGLPDYVKEVEEICEHLEKAKAILSVTASADALVFHRREESEAESASTPSLGLSLQAPGDDA